MIAAFLFLDILFLAVDICHMAREKRILAQMAQNLEGGYGRS